MELGTELVILVLRLIMSLAIVIASIILPIVIKIFFFVLKIMVKTGVIFPFIAFCVLKPNMTHLLLYKILSCIAMIVIIGINIVLWYKRNQENV